MITELLQPLTQGYTLVTPTGRLSQYLRHRYAVMQIEAGRSTWETPDILHWNAWLQRTWEEVAIQQDFRQVLLGSELRHRLWQGIINNSAYAGQLLQTAQTARQAVAAWTLCQQWQIKHFPDDIYINQDVFAFLQWLEIYQKQCESQGWIDEDGIAEVLLSADFNQLKIALTGFDEYTPLQEKLLARVQSTGGKIKYQSLIRRRRDIAAYRYRDEREEIHAAAKWARQLLESNPGESIGIVVPGLRTRHTLIENIFNDVLLPGNILVNSEDSQRPFIISQGIPLNQYPVIDSALLVLGLCKLSISPEEFGSLLRSPFIVDAEREGQRRAKFDACLRKYGENRITFNTLYKLINSDLIHQDDLPGNFIHAFKESGKIIQSCNKKQPASEWAKIFSELLKTFGWPGERPLNSAEYQTIAEWQAVLGRFAMLDQILQGLNFKEALSQLRYQVINSSFQPETSEVPIQILGLAGTAGMQFDHLRIICLHEEAWPPGQEPNPFIPIKVQRDLNMPDASAENKLKWSRNLMQRLIDSSPDVVMTCPQNEKDRVIRPSPLILDYLQSEDKSPDNTVSNYAEKIFVSRQIELIEDSQAPSLPAGEIVKGGAGLFKDQAACPFRAFARYRLDALSLGARDIGLDAMERGLIIHDVMERLWNHIGSHQALITMNDIDLKRLIDDVISKTTDEFQKKFPLTFTRRFTEIEHARLHALASDWLELERRRQPFTVRGSEQWQRFKFKDIEIKTRIDRIDQLVDGRFVIIDYKTGDPSVKDWFGERPEEPQLPLYAINTDGEVAAIVYARIKRGENAFLGLAEEDELIPGINTIEKVNTFTLQVQDWETMFDTWRETLKHLADNFRNGVAVVDPKDNTTCRYCDLHTFCRIYEKESVITDQQHEHG